MRTLTATLLAAQKAESAIPAVGCVIDDRHIGVMRYRWTSLQTSADAGGPNAMTRDVFYLIRAWTDGSGNLKVSRASVYGGGFGAWATVATGVELTAQIALAGLGGKVWLFYFGSNAHMYARSSVDEGGTWSAASDLGDVGVGNNYVVTNAGVGICGCFSGTVDVMGMVAVRDTGTSVRLIGLAHKIAGAGTWYGTVVKTISAPTAAQGVQLARGCACFPSGINTALNIGAVYAGPWSPTVYSSIQKLGLAFNETTNAFTLTEWGAILNSSAVNFLWQWPSAWTRILTDGRNVCGVVEDNGISKRVNYFSLYPLGGTSEEFAMTDLVPLNVTTAAVGADGFGWAGANDGAGLQYAGNSHVIWTSPGWWTGHQYGLDVSADVLAYNARESYRLGGTLVLVLRNEAGAYDGVFKRGMQVQLSDGFLTSLGYAERSCGPLWWIERITNEMSGKLTLVCYNSLGKLTRMEARQYQEWKTGGPVSVLREAVRRFGFIYHDDSTASLVDATGIPPAFHITPGGAWFDVVTEAMDYAGVELFENSPAVSVAGYPALAFGVPGVVSTCTYGGAGNHRIVSGSYGVVDSDAAWVHMTGMAYTDAGEAVDQDLIDELGFASNLSVLDARVSSTTVVTPALRASYALALAKRRRRFGTLVVGMHCGQEMLDMVSVNDGRYVFDARVVGISRVYDPSAARYEMTLLLGDL